MNNEIENYTEENNMFESIKHIDEEGNEYWEARELQKILEYSKWENFNKVIRNAILACENSGNDSKLWFPEVRKPIITGKGKKEMIQDYHLSRYACYLIAQNGDSRKEVIALAQTYFATQTRKQELLERDYNLLSEDEKRLYQRSLTKKGNYTLNQTAKKAGVKNFDKFHNSGYKGLYGGETADDIAKRKGLRYREDILDNMGSTELAANWFRITQTDDKLLREIPNSESEACDIHYKVGKEVRNSIKRLGGTLPEKLPKPDKSLKELDKQ